MKVTAHTRLAKSAFSENLDTIALQEDDGEKQNLYLGLHEMACALDELNKKLVTIQQLFQELKTKEPE